MTFPIRKLKHCFVCCDSKRVPLNAAERGLVPGAVPYWGANSVQDYVKDHLFDEELVLLGEDGAPFFDPFRDVAFRVTGPIWPNNHVHVLRPKSGVDARYLTYALNSIVDYSLYVGGATRDKLTQGAMDTIELPFPSYVTQTAIANYLDAKTAAIDALIAKKEELVEELKKYEAAVISEAVTPKAGWEAVSLKYAVSINPEVLPENTSSDVLLRYIDIAALDSESSTLTPTAISFGEAPSRARRVVQAGDTIISTVRTYLKAVATFGNVEPNTVASTGFAVLRPNARTCAEFLKWAIKSDQFISEVIAYSEGVSYPAIAPSVLGQLKLFLPPISEQGRIAHALEAQSFKIQKSCVLLQTGIQELKAYRASLISEAVTGKLTIPT